MSTELESTLGGVTEAGTVADLADLAAESQRVPVAVGGVYLVRNLGGGLTVLDTDAYAETPRHVKGARVVTDAASFVAYVNRHKITGTEVYHHAGTSSVVGVIDSHEGADADPGWQKHTVRLVLEHSKAWAAWAAADGKLFDQAAFADFLDDRYIDVIDPAPAVLIDIARTFQAKTKVDFESGIREGSGDVTLNYVEETTAKAGQKGDIQIPARIQLAVRPYLGGPIYSIWANFRYRLTGGNVVLGFRLERPENILEAAFADIVTEIRDGRVDTRDGVDTVVHQGVGDVPIFAGKPSA